MIPKLILSESYNYDGPAVSLVRFARSGVVKTANKEGVFDSFLKDFTPPKGQTVIHVIAVGDEEKYGPNRNCDAFSATDNVTAHESFKTNGHVFRNHQNDNPSKAVGDVIKTAHNAEMSRIELLLGLNPDKCPKEIQALETGGDVPTSMGSVQQFDTCSYCGHNAPTSKDHCDHIKNQLGLVASDGRKVYMKNPKPKYFDISLVYKPADRIAYTLKKVAAEQGRIIGGHELAEMAGVEAPFDLAKTAARRVLAAMIKQVPATLKKAAAPTRIDSEALADLQKQAQIHGLRPVLSALMKQGHFLAPEDFGALIGHQAPIQCKVAVEQFAPDADMAILDIEAFEPVSAWEHPSFRPSTAEALRKHCSLDPQPVQGRVLHAALTPVAKVAAELPEAELRGFAELYAQYGLAYAVQHSTRPDRLGALAATW
jgi:hypothetical protein